MPRSLSMASAFGVTGPCRGHMLPHQQQLVWFHRLNLSLRIWFSVLTFAASTTTLQSSLSALSAVMTPPTAAGTRMSQVTVRMSLASRTWPVRGREFDLLHWLACRARIAGVCIQVVPVNWLARSTGTHSHQEFDRSCSTVTEYETATPGHDICSVLLCTLKQRTHPYPVPASCTSSLPLLHEVVPDKFHWQNK